MAEKSQESWLRANKEANLLSLLAPLKPYHRSPSSIGAALFLFVQTSQKPAKICRPLSLKTKREHGAFYFICSGAKHKATEQINVARLPPLSGSAVSGRLYPARRESQRRKNSHLQVRGVSCSQAPPFSPCARFSCPELQLDDFATEL